MGLKSNKTQLHYLLMENKIVENKKKGDIQCHIGPSACSIPKSLQRDPLFKWRIK